MMKYENPILAIVAVGLFSLCLVGQVNTFGLGDVVEASNPNVGQGHHVEADLYKKPKRHPLQKVYPELFTTEAIVVAFGADWCPWCKVQARTLKGPSQRYNILYVKVEDEDGNPTRWATLSNELELGSAIPVTVVIEKGEVKKVFHGHTPWAEIEPHAKKAKKNKDQKNHIDIGPIHIDWDDDGIDINRHKRNKRRM